MKNILVYCWCYKQNIGDQLFIEAFKKIFDYNFTFTDHIKPHHLNNIDAVFFGGGSFLLGKPDITDAALELIKKKPIFYIGVGVESEVHPIHLDLMKVAKLIATRSSDKIDFLKTINKNAFFVPDIVYSLSNDKVLLNKNNKGSYMAVGKTR